jgi:transcription termination factor Rho
VQYAELETKTIDELRDLARDSEIAEPQNLKKPELIFRLLQSQPEYHDHQASLIRRGVLEIMDEGYGFLRLDRHWLPGPEDVYVAQAQIRKFGLRTGDEIAGQLRLPKESAGEKYASLVRIDAVNGVDPDLAPAPALV